MLEQGLQWWKGLVPGIPLRGSLLLLLTPQTLQTLGKNVQIPCMYTRAPPTCGQNDVVRSQGILKTGSQSTDGVGMPDQCIV